ncbi:MAG: hypothetical protein IJT73_09735, partial [Selenomonadaceae bacterium]|nr:hypothetical protein [Selenomonadaceae bacterium]
PLKVLSFLQVGFSFFRRNKSLAKERISAALNRITRFTTRRRPSVGGVFQFKQNFFYEKS